MALYKKDPSPVMAEVQEPVVAKGVLVGPLYTDRSPDELARNIFRLLKSVGVRCSEISKIAINSKIGYAKIGLHRLETEDFVVNVFQEVKNIMNLYDLRNLLEDPEQLIVQRVKEEVIDQRIPLHKRIISDSNILFLSQTKLEELEAATSTENSTPGGPDPSDQNETGSGGETSTATPQNASSVPEIHTELTSKDSGSSVDLRDHPMLINVKTSTPFLVPCDCPETIFYHQMQHIGTETRHAEFKKGGAVHDERVFRELISKYVCGFLNSGGGTIFFGVDDEGVVRGVTVDNTFQATLRKDVLFAVRLIEPNVKEDEYSINFACVMGASGDLAPNLKVLEVCVKPREHSGRYYFYNGTTYIRRDGSLQAVKKSNVTRPV